MVREVPIHPSVSNEAGGERVYIVNLHVNFKLHRSLLLSSDELRTIFFSRFWIDIMDYR